MKMKRVCLSSLFKKSADEDLSLLIKMSKLHSVPLNADSNVFLGL